MQLKGLTGLLAALLQISPLEFKTCIMGRTI